MKKIVLSFIVLTTIVFTTNAQETGTFRDTRDGKVYKTVKIGNKLWMAENLAYAPTSGKYWAYNNDNSNIEIYGYLYDWRTALNVCPAGWHLPSDAEWTELTDYLGGTRVAAGKLKETGTTHWGSPNTGATNETGFTALPGGFRNFYDYSEQFGYLRLRGYWWSATKSGIDRTWSRIMDYDNGIVYSSDGFRKNAGMSVRCVRD